MKGHVNRLVGKRKASGKNKVNIKVDNMNQISVRKKVERKGRGMSGPIMRKGEQEGIIKETQPGRKEAEEPGSREKEETPQSEGE